MSSDPKPPPAGAPAKELKVKDSDSPVFAPLNPDADIDRLNRLPTLCFHCGEDGEIRMLLTMIPYFREVVVMSFTCDECGAVSNEIQQAAEIQEKSAKFTLKVVGKSVDVDGTKKDLNRQCIKSATAALFIPELKFEIPPSKRGEINTVEGILINVKESLQVNQPNRYLQDAEQARKIQDIIDAVQAMADGEREFTFVIDDLAGNSFIENPFAPAVDPRIEIKYYERTREQTIELGYQVEENKEKDEEKQRQMKAKINELHKGKKNGTNNGDFQPFELTDERISGVKTSPHVAEKLDTYFNVSDRSATIPGECPACHRECETRLCVTDVPHFKDIVLLVTDCATCGYRDSEVKPMGQVSEKGIKITLNVTKEDDLKRDLLKSDTAMVRIEELDLELGSGTLGGKYTTLEGLMEDIKASLENSNVFAMGDSSEGDSKQKFADFLARLGKLSKFEEPFTFILDDPLGNSFIYSPLGREDPHMKVESYERTFEQNEDLGLNDLNVDPDDYLDNEEDKEILAEEIRKDEEEKKKNAGKLAIAAKKQEEEKAVALEERKKWKIGGKIDVGDTLIQQTQTHDNTHTASGTSSSTGTSS